MRQEGTSSHVLVILNVCSVPQMCISHVACAVCLPSVRNLKFIEPPSRSVIYMAVNYIVPTQQFYRDKLDQQMRTYLDSQVPGT